MSKQVFVMAHDLARRRAVVAVVEAPAGYVITVAPARRTLDQNSKFHAICAKFNGQPWYGMARDAEAWKTLLVSGHTVATGGAAEVVPGLEAEFVSIRESTARMSKARSSSLIEYTIATATQRGIEVGETEAQQC